jgi:hypothetical protein
MLHFVLLPCRCYNSRVKRHLVSSERVVEILAAANSDGSSSVDAPNLRRKTPFIY